MDHSHVAKLVDLALCCLASGTFLPYETFYLVQLLLQEGDDFISVDQAGLEFPLPEGEYMRTELIGVPLVMRSPSIGVQFLLRPNPALLERLKP